MKQKAIRTFRLNIAHICFITTIALSACATKQPEPMTNASTAAETATLQADKTDASKQVETDNKAPEKPLTADFIYHYLMAEISGQRGDFSTSSAMFYRLAQEEQDARFAERAAKIAAYGRINNLVLPSVQLWATLAPESAEAQQAITEILVKGNQLEKAKPHLKQLLANEKTRARGFLFIHNILNKSDDKQAVLTLTQSLAKPYPQLPEAHLAIAQSAAVAQKIPLALEALTNADTLRSGWIIAAALKGQLLFNESPQSAIDFYHSFLFAHPGQNEIRINLAKVLVNESQYALAKKEYPTIIQYAQSAVETSGRMQITPKHQPAMRQKAEKNLADITAVIGLLSFQSKDYAAANSYLQQALDLNFSDPEQIYLYFGQIAEKQAKNKIAKNWYEQITAGQHFLSAQLNIANLIKQQTSVDEAITFLDTVDHLTQPQQVIVIQTQAAMLHEASRHSDAFDFLKHAIQQMPSAPPLIYDYALSAERLGKFDLMETQLRNVIKAKPTFAAAYNALGYSFADRNIKLNEALTLINTALRLSPNDHYMLDSLGWVYFKQGQLTQAIKYLRQAYLIQHDPEIAAHLGEVLWQQGNHQEAQKIWDDALAKHPENAVLTSTALKFKR